MKLRYIASLLGVATVTLAETEQQHVFGTPSESNMVSHSTPFCKMDKEKNLGPGCDVTFTEINEINANIRQDILGLVQTDFFKYFKFDPNRKCTFWDNNDGLCFSRSCAIDVVEDWDKLPEYWQPEVLGGLNNDTTDDSATNLVDDEVSFLNQLCEGKKQTLQSDEDLDYYDITDFTSKDAVLVDLTKNPERFTGYGGQQAGQIWTSIYGENCFSTDEDDTCLAKDAFYRIVSGLHASIGTHLSNDHLDTETGEWGPNLDLFMARVGNFPDRVSNIYFNYAIVAKSLWKIKPYLKDIDFCNDYNNEVKQKIINIESQLESRIFNEDLMFEGDYSSSIKEDFRSRFKNVTKIMDCVHCDRCKMWGKVQTTGYATSLKILFELDEADEQSKQQVVNKLTKFELIALLNTFDRLSKSIESINNFETLYNNRVNGNQGKLASFFQNNNFFKSLAKAKDSIIDKVQKINESVNNTENDNVKEAQSPKFEDVKVTYKKVKTSLEQENIWRKAWRTETHNVLEAFKFIYRSYIDLPRNAWNMILVNFNKVWNSFIGVADYLDEEEKDLNVYKLDLQ